MMIDRTFFSLLLCATRLCKLIEKIDTLMPNEPIRDLSTAFIGTEKKFPKAIVINDRKNFKELPQKLSFD